MISSCGITRRCVRAASLVGTVVFLLLGPATSSADAAHADDALNMGIEAATDGALGAAVLAFERALRMAPLDREIQDARAAAQSEARRRRAEANARQSFVEGEPSAVTRWRFFGMLRAEVYALLLLAGTWWTFGLLGLRRRSKRTAVKDALTVGTLLGGAVMMASGSMWVGAVLTGGVGVAVVVGDDPHFREAPDELSRRRSQPNLYEGAVVVVLEERGAYARVRLVDGESVWVEEGDVELVTPAHLDDD